MRTGLYGRWEMEEGGRFTRWGTTVSAGRMERGGSEVCVVGTGGVVGRKGWWKNLVKRVWDT